MKKELYEKYFPNREEIILVVPAILIKEDDYYVIATTDEGEAMLGQPAYSQGKSRDEAEKEFWNMVRIMNKYHEERSQELDLWKPFQKGKWGHIGGTWFTIFGLHMYFRYGKGMKGGWYIPFTKLNIIVNNYWRSKIKKD